MNFYNINFEYIILFIFINIKKYNKYIINILIIYAKFLFIKLINNKLYIKLFFLS